MLLIHFSITSIYSPVSNPCAILKDKNQQLKANTFPCAERRTNQKKINIYIFKETSSTRSAWSFSCFVSNSSRQSVVVCEWFREPDLPKPLNDTARLVQYTHHDQSLGMSLYSCFISFFFYYVFERAEGLRKPGLRVAARLQCLLVASLCSNGWKPC